MCPIETTHIYSTLCRLGESASQSGVNAELQKTLRSAASYIAELEKKLEHLDETRSKHGDCPLTEQLEKDIEGLVADQDQAEASEKASAASSSSRVKRSKEADWDGAWQSEWDEDWAAWESGRWEGEGDGEWDEDWDEEWAEDAQPPSDHLQAAAAASSLAPSPAPAFPREGPGAPEPEMKMNSSTHRKEWMKLAT